MQEVVAFEASDGTDRRLCYQVFIIDDALVETTESFGISLESLDGQAGVKVDPASSEVFILDNDGK